MSISVLIVLYNQRLDDIVCLSVALSSAEVTDVVVCDNSTQSNGNARRAQELGVTYIDMEGNKGLSKAYNFGVARCKGDVICLFDDDTQVDGGYFSAVADLCMSDTTWDIALPLVITNGQILSPCEFDGYRTRMFGSPEAVTESSRLSGINSGMAVRSRVYSRIGYDETLFLDLVDHRFILDAREMGFRIIYLVGPVLMQDFSLESDSADSAAKRLSIYEHDARAFYSKRITERIYCWAMLMHRKSKLSRKYGSKRFFKQPAFIPEGDN